ncbi:MAG: 4Fe-4S binding protein [Roseovarius sp.]
MPQDIRGNFYSGKRGGLPGIRPPGALKEPALEDKCTGCGDCAAVCPQEIISLDAHSLPVMTSLDSCAKCGLCADVCMMGAIELTLETRLGLARLKSAETKIGVFCLSPLAAKEMA